MGNNNPPSSEEAQRAFLKEGHQITPLVVAGSPDYRTPPGGTSVPKDGAMKKFATSIGLAKVNSDLPEITQEEWDTIIPKRIQIEDYTEPEKIQIKEYATNLENALKSEKYFEDIEVTPIPGWRGMTGSEGLIDMIHERLRENSSPKLISEEAIKNFGRLLIKDGLFPLSIEETALDEKLIKPHYIYGLPYERYIASSQKYVAREEGESEENHNIRGTAISLSGYMTQSFETIAESDKPLITFVLLNEKECNHFNRSLYGPPPLPQITQLLNESENARKLRRAQELTKFREENPEYLPQIDLENSQMVQKFREEYTERYRRAVLGKIEQKDKGLAAADRALTEAIIFGASDIHVDPQTDHKKGASYNISIRVDGKRRFRFSATPQQGNELINSLIMQAGRAERDRRKPFGGNVSCKIFNRSNIFLRLSTLPAGTYFNVGTGKEEPLETLVARIAEVHGEALDLEKLGMPKYMENELKKMALQESGINILIGATGQGKTTTLAAVLKKMNSLEERIITFENPIERRIKGIVHTEENPEAGYTIEAFSKEIVRQDPETIMIGEIRDESTYQLAANMAITGHLVYTTLHAESVQQAPSRLFGLMRDTAQARTYNNIMALTLNTLLAQKLSIRLCKECNVQYDGREEIAKMLDYPEDYIKKQFPEPLMVYRAHGRDKSGRGCKKCEGYGERGRIVVPQFLPITHTIRKLIDNEEKDPDRYLEEGRKVGLITFPELGILYALDGFISLKEMTRNLADENKAFMERENIVKMMKKWQNHKDWYTSERNPFIEA